MRRAYRGSTRVLGLLVLLIGIALVVSTLVGGGGPLARGVIIGLLFAALGAGRLFIARGRA